VFHWVELLARYSNFHEMDSLREVLRRIAAGDQTEAPGLVGASARWPPRNLRDRLEEADVQELVESYQTGSTIRALARRFMISESSVKRLLRQHGVKRRGTNDK
jgi:DNA invertase Pin-like site-specific DNA recombinase